MDGATAAAVLGVSERATGEEIRRAFRARAKFAHPDGAGTEDAFVALRAAFEYLLQALPVASLSPDRRWPGATGPIRPASIDLTDTRPRGRPVSSVVATNPRSTAQSGRRFAAVLAAELARS
jgi:DnaJ domain